MAWRRRGHPGRGRARAPGRAPTVPREPSRASRIRRSSGGSGFHLARGGVGEGHVCGWLRCSRGTSFLCGLGDGPLGLARRPLVGPVGRLPQLHVGLEGSNARASADGPHRPPAPGRPSRPPVSPSCSPRPPGPAGWPSRPGPPGRGGRSAGPRWWRADSGVPIAPSARRPPGRTASPTAAQRRLLASVARIRAAEARTSASGSTARRAGRRRQPRCPGAARARAAWRRPGAGPCLAAVEDRAGTRRQVAGRDVAGPRAAATRRGRVPPSRGRARRSTARRRPALGPSASAPLPAVGRGQRASCSSSGPTRHAPSSRAPARRARGVADTSAAGRCSRRTSPWRSRRRSSAFWSVASRRTSTARVALVGEVVRRRVGDVAVAAGHRAELQPRSLLREEGLQRLPGRLAHARSSRRAPAPAAASEVTSASSPTCSTASIRSSP